jgi:hypothetical protein
MADEPVTNGGGTETGSSQDEARKKLIYESNPKHSEPWQIGKKGSLCEADVRPAAAALLSESVFWEGKRYAVRMGKAYCAQEHSPNRWHGYPVGWQAVPPKLAWQWIRNGVLRKHDFKKYWEAH